MRTGTTAQTFGILLTLAGCLIPVVVSRGDLVDREHAAALDIFRRQGVSASAAANTSPAAAASQATSETPTTQAAASTSAAPASSSAQQQQSSTSAAQPSSTAQQQQSSSSQAPAATSNKPSNAATSAAAIPTTVTSALVTTDAGGQVVTSVVVVTDTPTTSAKPSSSAAGSNNSSSNSSSGVSSSTIIGLSVAGGVAVLCVVGFFVWKFTRKRIGDYDNNEEIKWPELNAHDTGVPLPTNRTGGAGFDTAMDGGRSSIGYAPSTTANSTAELQPDPYAIPALPHLDPNQPYRDDPNAAYYDPYRGPVPQSFSPIGPGPGEVIPMTQLAGSGRRSPGPGPAYAGDFGSGRASPGPGGHAAYGSGDYGGRASPSPRAAQPGRSMSPGPLAAYGNAYGPR